MRILGFSKKWDKLYNPILFTTFRYPRRDRDWEVEEVVQVVFKPRTKDREPLGIARIIRIKEKDMGNEWRYGFGMPVRPPNTPDMISPDEAKEDGFTGQHGGGDVRAMIDFIKDYSRGNIVNKLTLYWIERSTNEQDKD